MIVTFIVQGNLYLTEVSHHLLYEGPHRRDVDQLKVIRVNRAVQVDVFTNLPQDAEQRNIRLTCTLN